MDIPQGYKQTELGIIPEDWEVVVIGEQGILQNRSVNPQQEPHKIFCEYSMPSYDNDKIPIYRCGNEMYSSRFAICGPVLLFNKLNVRQKRIWFLENTPSDSICSMEFLPYSSDSIDLLLLSHILGTDQSTEYFVGLSKGTSNSQKRIRPIDFISKKIAIPSSLAEQQTIAEALSDIDGLIAALDKKIAKKRLIKQGAMQQLLTGKKRLPGFTDPWVETKLGEILDYEQPQPYLVVSTDYVDSGIPVLTAGKSLILGYTTEQFGVYNKLPVIIFDDFTTDSKYISYPFKVKSSAMKMLSLKNNDYDLRLVYELMQQIDFPLKDHQRYWISEYSQLTISIPKDREEQTAIATILTDMDKEIAELEAQRDKYRLLKSGMMQKLLTGQIRLKINRI